MIGYVAMRRDWQDHDIFEGDIFSRRDAWAWLVANAAWKGTKARIKGSGVILGRGELSFSVRFLANKWGWSKSAVDRFLHLLRTEGMIEVRTKSGTTAGQQAGHPAGQGQSIITICNYEKYQAAKSADGTTGGTGVDQKAGQQRDKEEEGKNIYSVSNDTDEDADRAFWSNAKAYLKPYVKGDPGSLIGKWLKQRGKADTAKAITAAQIERAANPIEYVHGYFRKHAGGSSKEFEMPC